MMNHAFITLHNSATYTVIVHMATFSYEGADFTTRRNNNTCNTNEIIGQYDMNGIGWSRYSRTENNNRWHWTIAE